MPQDGKDGARGAGGSSWTLLTNHGAVLIYVIEHPETTIREAAAAVGITERATARILRDLRTGGYLRARRVGRRNVYQYDASRPLRHHQHRDKRVADLVGGLVDVEVLAAPPRKGRGAAARGPARGGIAMAGALAGVLHDWAVSLPPWWPSDTMGALQTALF